MLIPRLSLCKSSNYCSSFEIPFIYCTEYLPASCRLLISSSMYPLAWTTDHSVPDPELAATVGCCLLLHAITESLNKNTYPETDLCESISRSQSESEYAFGPGVQGRFHQSMLIPTATYTVARVDLMYYYYVPVMTKVIRICGSMRTTTQWHVLPICIM